MSEQPLQTIVIPLLSKWKFSGDVNIVSLIRA